MNSLAVFLSKAELLDCLPPAEIEKLSLLAQVGRYAKGETIYNEGESADSIWLLQFGRAVIFKYQTDGRPLAIDAIQPKHMLSTLDRMGEPGSTYSCTAVACSDAVTVRIPARYFQILYGRYPAMVASLCQLCSRQLARMRDRVVSYQEPVQQRILRTLFQLAENSGNTLPYTKREISELSGTTVETVIRVMSQLRKKHWVDSERGSITLRDIPHLQSLITAA